MACAIIIMGFMPIAMGLMAADAPEPRAFCCNCTQPPPGTSGYTSNQLHPSVAATALHYTGKTAAKDTTLEALKVQSQQVSEQSAPSQRLPGTAHTTCRRGPCARGSASASGCGCADGSSHGAGLGCGSCAPGGGAGPAATRSARVSWQGPCSPCPSQHPPAHPPPCAPPAARRDLPLAPGPGPLQACAHQRRKVSQCRTALTAHLLAFLQASAAVDGLLTH